MNSHKERTHSTRGQIMTTLHSFSLITHRPHELERLEKKLFLSDGEGETRRLNQYTVIRCAFSVIFFIFFPTKLTQIKW